MNEVVANSSIAPLAPGPAPIAEPDRLTQWRRVIRIALAPATFARRRPGRAAAVSAVLILIGFGLTFAGRFLWAYHHMHAARTAVKLGHNAVAIRHLHACQTVLPDHPEVLLLSARVAWRTGSWSEAESLLDRYWNLHGEDDSLVLERLVLRAAHGAVEAAGPLLLARIENDDSSAAIAREALATGLLFRFRWQEAGRLIDRWLEHTPGQITAQLLRGKLQEQRQHASEAILTYKRILEADPEHDEARMRLTTLLLQFNQGDDAAAHLDYLRHRLPNHPEVQLQWVRALELQGRTGEARAALDECLKSFPEHAGILAERGKVAAQEGDTQLAEEFLARATRRDPGNVATLYQYVLVLGRNQKPDEAGRVLVAIRQLEADNERIGVLIRLLQTTPNDPAIAHEIGMISARAGQKAEALRWFQSALQLDPNYVPTHRVLAGYYQQSGDPILAARHRAMAMGAPARPTP